MSSSPPQSSGPFTPLTGYQVVEYLKEQAHYLGELGYSTNFSEPDAFFQNITRQRKNDQSPSTTKPDAPDPLDEDQIVQKALHNVTMTERLLLHRQSLLTDVRNLPVVAEAERYIDHRLRSLGKSERYLSSTSLRGKIVNMIETTSPKPKENGVTMMIYMPGLAPTKDDMVKIQMPLKACIEDVHDVLEDLLRAEMSYVTGYVMKEFDKWERKPWPCWQYQIAARGKKRPVDAVFAALHTNEDYKRLISKVTSGPSPPHAILTKASFLHCAFRSCWQS